VGTHRRCHCDGCRKLIAEPDAAIEAKKSDTSSNDGIHRSSCRAAAEMTETLAVSLAY